MTDDLKTKIATAVAAAIDALHDSEVQSEKDAEENSKEPHRFGFFKLPANVHIKGFGKFLE